MMNETRMLTLYAPLSSDDLGQTLARFVKDGFKAESWNALAESGSVYEARITALPDPNVEGRFASLLLCTTYEGPAPEYHRFFWDKLTLFFALVAFAAADPPFTPADLTPEQAEAFGTAEKLLLLSDSNAPGAADALKALPDAMKLVTKTMNTDDEAVKRNELKESKFTRFSNWVRKHDLTGSVGLPADGESNKPKDLHVAPVGSERNQFVSANLPIPPWPPIAG